MKKVKELIEGFIKPKEIFPILHPGIEKQREEKTKDIVRRALVITPHQVKLKGYPIKHPASIFNPALKFNEKENKLEVYGRIIMGYFSYASAIVKLTLELDEIYSPNEKREWEGEIVVYPSLSFDIWGTEDPRITQVDDQVFITYCGRTVNYFNPAIRVERALPIITVKKDGEWKKVSVVRVPPKLRKNLVSDKDAFVFKIDDQEILFHRPHFSLKGREEYHLVISKIPEKINQAESFKEVIIKDSMVFFKKAEFEVKIGWGTPPVEISKNKYLILLHGVDKRMRCYRVFACLFDKNLNLLGLTKYYIMQPKETYEIYGDRPWVIFPCGIEKLDDKILISYGAADSFIGIGEIDLSEILSEMDKVKV